LTSDEILAMKPGKELDALVAEKVMGWTWAETDSGLEGLFPPQEFAIHGFKPIHIFNDLGHLHGMPEYSTDITEAWEVIDAMQTEGWAHCVNSVQNHNYPQGIRHCCFSRPKDHIQEVDVPYISSEDKVFIHGHAKTTPDAICKAALLTKDAQL